MYSEPLNDLENKTYWDLEKLDAFDFIIFEDAKVEDNQYCNVKIEERTIEQTIEDESFIPPSVDGTWVLYGSLNHFFPLFWYFYTIYEWMLVADKIIRQHVEDKFIHSREVVISKAKKI